MRNLVQAFSYLVIVVSVVTAQNAASIDASRLPQEAAAVGQFVPKGWHAEAEVKGDLNQDVLPDVAVTLLAGAPPAKADANNRPDGEGQRALLILFGTKDGKLRRAALAHKVLQCASCGGAFYGVMKAPANVAIQKGVLIVEQEHGSRELSTQRLRFRFNSTLGKFELIGLDHTTTDRATGRTTSDSHNLLTGVRELSVRQYNEKLAKDATLKNTRTRSPLKRTVLEATDYEKLQMQLEQ